MTSTTQCFRFVVAHSPHSGQADQVAIDRFYTERLSESALRVFASVDRLANQTKIKDIGEVGKLVQKIEMGDPKTGKL